MLLVAKESRTIGLCGLPLVTAPNVGSTSLSPNFPGRLVASSASSLAARHATQRVMPPSASVALCPGSARGVPRSRQTQRSGATAATRASQSRSSALPGEPPRLRMPCTAASASLARLSMHVVGMTRTLSAPTRTAAASISKRATACRWPIMTRCSASRRAYALSAVKTNPASTAGLATSSGFQWITATRPASFAACCVNAVTVQSGYSTTTPSCSAKPSATCSVHRKEQFVKEGSSH